MSTEPAIIRWSGGGPGVRGTVAGVPGGSDPNIPALTLIIAIHRSGLNPLP